MRMKIKYLSVIITLLVNIAIILFLNQNRSHESDLYTNASSGLNNLSPDTNGKDQTDFIYHRTQEDMNDTWWIAQGYSVNPYSISFILEEGGICNARDVVIYVYSAIENSIKRNNIRKTWGNKKYLLQGRILVVFIVGNEQDVYGVNKTGTTPLIHNIKKESQTYHDIIQADIPDGYKSITYKGIAALKWIVTHCQKTKYVIKTDDDCIVNIFAIGTELVNDQLFGFNKDGDSLLVLQCDIQTDVTVHKAGRYQVTEDEFPYSYFPTHCPQEGYITTINALVKMYKAIIRVNFLWIEHVFITGLLPETLGDIDFRQMDYKDIRHGHMLKGIVKYYPEQLNTYLFLHANVDYENMLNKTWNKYIQIN